MSTQAKLAKWIARQKSSILHEVGPIARFELSHEVAGEIANNVDVWPVSSDDNANADDLAQEIWDRAEEDAASRFGNAPNRYEASAFFGTHQEPQSTWAFVLTRRRGRRGDHHEAEPPTKAGVIASIQRYATDNNRIMIAGQDSHQRVSDALFTRLEKSLDSRDKENATYREQFAKQVELTQTLMDRSHERSLEHQRELRKLDRTDQVFTLLTFYIPPLLRAFFPEKLKEFDKLGASEMEIKLMTFAMGLDENEFIKMLDSLGDEKKKLQLMEVYRSAKRKYEQQGGAPLLEKETSSVVGESNGASEIVGNGASKGEPAN